MTSERQFDAAIIGGGPGGAATAISLSRAGHSVALFERTHYESPRIGETLPPATRPLLERLGFWERFLQDKHGSSAGTLAAWGSGDLAENHFITNPYGSGWHLDRARFDAGLTQLAEEKGAQVYRDARAWSFEQVKWRGWRVTYSFAKEGTPSKRETLLARVLVDATGRAGLVGRTLRVKRLAVDKLIGIVRFYHAAQDDLRTLVEAAPDGWWYSAYLPNSRLIVAYMTDADLLPKSHAERRSAWQELLAQTIYTRWRVGEGIGEVRLYTLAANSYRLEHAAGADWIAVGDAALAFDPLSSQGIYNALDSGMRAAQTLHAQWCGERDAQNAYEEWIAARAARYLEQRAAYYARERRWRDRAFWIRRQEAI